MARNKIDYGIDLGTTNSAIARIEKGEPTIKKSDTLKDTIPSCIGFNKKGVLLAGDSAWNSLKSDRLRAMKSWTFIANFFIEFKRTMGQATKFDCTSTGKSYSSEDLSAEVLKNLKSFITDEDLEALVVTVPAKFQINQKEATKKAAELAGISQCVLLQEPIAASMAYGLDSKVKDGFWMVFDFGGGTFDAALVKLDDGIMQVEDTEGDNYLGGKNLDYAIVDELIIPWFEENYSIDSIMKDENKHKIFQDAMKYYAEMAKIQLSFKEEHNIISDLGDIPGEDDNGEEFELDIILKHEDMKRVLGPIFQKAVDITNELLKRNNLQGSDLGALILVGGPTFSPVLREMLEEQICKPDTSVDPMTAVAKGAALYAATIDVNEEIIDRERDTSKIQLSLGYEPTTADSQEYVTLKVHSEKTEGEIPSKLYADVIRSDQAWSSGKVEIGEMGEMITVELNDGKPNQFQVILYDDSGNKIDCEPDSFIIIQGTKLGSATLPYSLGIEVYQTSSKKMVVSEINGLKKNNTFPATGTKNALKTMQQVRPGNKEDFIRLSIYEMEYDADGSRAIYNQHVFDAVISGDDIPELLPEGSDLDLTVKCVDDNTVELSAYFPLLDFTHEFKYDAEAGVQEDIDTEWLAAEIAKARTRLNMILQDGDYNDKENTEKLEKELSEIEKRYEQGRNDDDRKKDVLDSLRRASRKLDDMEDASEWPKTEAELKDVFYKLEEFNREKGNEKTTEIVNVFKNQVQEVIDSKDVRLANKMIDDMRTMQFEIQSQDINYWIGFVYYFNESFDTHDWKDSGKARSLVNQGMQIVTNNPTEDKIRPIIAALFQLLPNPEEVIGDVGKGKIRE